MGKYKNSFKLEQGLVSAKRTIEKFESLARETSLGRSDLQPEFYVWRKIRRFDASCSKSLAKETRLQEEMSLCDDRTGKLDAQLLSCQAKLTDLESAQQTLENKKLALQQQLLKVEEKIAAIELALKSVQEKTHFLDNGEAQLKAVIIEYESRHRILQSERESLAGELAKVRVEIFTVEIQINKLTRDKSELSSEVVEMMKTSEKCDHENAKIICGVNTFVNFTGGENPEETDRNETELREELSERKRSDERGCDEYAKTVRVFNSSRSFSDRERLIETSPDKIESSTELSEIEKDVEIGNKLNANSPRVFDTSRSVNGENHKEKSLDKTKSSSELSEAIKAEKENQVNANTLGASRRILDGEHHKEKSRDETKLSSELSATKKDVEKNNQFSANTLREFGISRRFPDCDNHEEKTKDKTESLSESSKAKKDVNERDQEKANDFRVFNTTRNVSEGGNREDTTQKDRFFLENHSDNFGDESRKFQGFAADLATSHYEEGSLEGDLMKLRAKLSTLESYINKLIQEKGALLAELNQTKENAEKRDLENAKILRLLRSSENVNEGGSRKEESRKDQFFLQTHNENAGDEIRKIQELATDLQAKHVICESDKKLFEEELMKLRANWISNLESYLHKLIRDKTALLAELNETKENGERGDHEYALSTLRLINRSEGFASLENREETSQKERFFLQTHKQKSGDEVHKLRELAADLQTKYTTCKTELEKQKALIAAAISREEAATRAAREAARELQLKLDESHLDIEKRDVMIKTLRDDKRRLESNIQECARNDRQKCDSCAAELEEIRELCARIRKNTCETNPKLQDSVRKDQQSLKNIAHVEAFGRQTNGPLGYDAHEQKRATLLNKRDRENTLRDYAKHDELKIVEVVNRGKSILQGAGERRRDFYLSESLKEQRRATREQGPESRSSPSQQRQFDSISKRANRKTNFELKRSDVGYKREYRDCCHGELDALKAMMAADEITEQMEKDLDGKAAEFNGKCEDLRSDIGELQSESSNDATETGVCASVLESQEQNDVVVSNGHEMMSMDGEVNGRESPATWPEDGGFDTVTSVDAETDDFPEMRMRRESLQQLCDVLMEERDRATSSLKEKDDEVLRLRKRLLESEQERGSLKNQLAKALGRSVLTEKEVVNAKEENAKLRAEIARLTKRIEELEAENSDLKSRLGKASADHSENQTPSDSENVTLSRVEELQEQPASSVISSAEGDEDKNQEISNVADKEKSEIADEAKRADETKDSESAARESEDVVRRRERAAKRTAPNYFRHSFAGSLPRPFHSHELPRQSSVSRENASHHERSESFQSDTSGESESSEGVSHPAAGIPSFMRKADKASFIKSGYSPVQFNYQPLPESISHRRESWDPMRHSAMMERAKGRGDSLNRTHESSSDSESSGFGSLSREQHTNELNAAPDDLDGGHGKRTDEVEIENFGVVIQLSSLPSTDSQKHAENSQNSKDLISAPTASVLESHASVPLQGEEHLESNDRSQVHAEEDEKRENVSELVNIWNSRTTEVLEV